MRARFQNDCHFLQNIFGEVIFELMSFLNELSQNIGFDLDLILIDCTSPIVNEMQKETAKKLRKKAKEKNMDEKNRNSMKSWS